MCGNEISRNVKFNAFDKGEIQWYFLLKTQELMNKFVLLNYFLQVLIIFWVKLVNGDLAIQMVENKEMLTVLRKFKESIFHSLHLKLEYFLEKRSLSVKHS